MLPRRSFPPLVDRCLFLAGPTASGKSSVALLLAERLGGELLSLDSIAVYRRMDIGTAKPSPQDRRRVPHHLLDLAEPSEEFSVSRFLEAAHAAVGQIVSRGRLPIFVGGTPLYMKGLLRGFFAGPPADWDFRASVQADLDRYGAAALHRRLAQVDPLAAHRLHPSDVRRITRALEVAYLTGHPLSHQQLQFDQAHAPHQCRVFALRWARATLNQRIDRRVEQMFAAGLVEEVRALIATGQPPLSRTAAAAVGYREVLATLRVESGSPVTPEAFVPPAGIDETIATVKLHTHQMAKRQETWLKSLSEVRFVDVASEDSPAVIAQRVLESL